MAIEKRTGEKQRIEDAKGHSSLNRTRAALRIRHVSRLSALPLIIITPFELALPNLLFSIASSPSWPSASLIRLAHPPPSCPAHPCSSRFPFFMGHHVNATATIQPERSLLAQSIQHPFRRGQARGADEPLHGPCGANHIGELVQKCLPCVPISFHVARTSPFLRGIIAHFLDAIAPSELPMAGIPGISTGRNWDRNSCGSQCYAYSGTAIVPRGCASGLFVLRCLFITCIFQTGIPFRFLHQTHI